MSTTRVEIDPDIAKRLANFLRSELFVVQSGVAKSDYWAHHAAQLETRIDGGTVRIGGESGFYVPRSGSLLQRVMNRARATLHDPQKVLPWITSRLASRFGVPRLMSYDQAFDAVMGSAEISEPIRSRFRIDHARLASVPGVFANSTSVRSHYRSWSGLQASENIINHYYYSNVLRGIVKPGEVRTILEIGPGSGNLASIFYHDWAPVRLILVDLPETCAVAIPFISSVFPQARLLLPHEVAEATLDAEFDFAFLTVDQLHLIRTNSVDLAINCHSFQEMTPGQIGEYFSLVQDVCRPSGLFFVANRLEKIPCGADALTADQPAPPNRFAEYPWARSNEDVIYEISKLQQLTQLHHVAVRLQRVIK
jgi:putative sugar O-methyltransferase